MVKIVRDDHPLGEQRLPQSLEIMQHQSETKYHQQNDHNGPKSGCDTEEPLHPLIRCPHNTFGPYFHNPRRNEATPTRSLQSPTKSD